MVIWTKPARDDLRQIHDFISPDSKFYAEKVVENIIARTEQIENFPNSGRVVPEILDDNVREIFVYSYRLIYEISEKNIYILSVVHGSRDFEKLVK